MNNGATTIRKFKKRGVGDSSGDTMTGVRREVGVVDNGEFNDEVIMEEQKQPIKRKKEETEAEGENDTIKKKKDDEDGENVLPSPSSTLTPTPILELSSSSSSSSDEINAAMALLSSSTTTVDKQIQKEIEQTRKKIKELYFEAAKGRQPLTLDDLMTKGGPLDLKMKLLEHLLHKTSVGVFTVILSSHFNEQNIDEKKNYIDHINILDLAFNFCLLSSKVDLFELTDKAKEDTEKWENISRIASSIQENKHELGDEFSFFSALVALNEVNPINVDGRPDVKLFSEGISLLLELKGEYMSPNKVLEASKIVFTETMKTGQEKVLEYTSKLNSIFDKMISTLDDLSNFSGIEGSLARAVARFDNVDHLIQVIQGLATRFEHLSTSVKNRADALTTSNESAEKMMQAITAKYDEAVSNFENKFRILMDVPTPMDVGMQVVPGNDKFDTLIEHTTSEGFMLHNLDSLSTYVDVYHRKLEEVSLFYANKTKELAEEMELIRSQGKFDSSHAAIYSAFFILRTELNRIRDQVLISTSPIAGLLKYMENHNQINWSNVWVENNFLEFTVKPTEQIFKNGIKSLNEFNSCVMTFNKDKASGGIPLIEAKQKLEDKLVEVATNTSNLIDILLNNRAQFLEDQQPTNNNNNNNTNLHAVIKTAISSGFKDNVELIKGNIEQAAIPVVEELKKVQETVNNAIRIFETQSKSVKTSLNTTENQLNNTHSHYTSIKPCFWKHFNKIQTEFAKLRNVRFDHYWQLAENLIENETDISQIITEIGPAFKKLYSTHILKVKKKLHQECVVQNIHDDTIADKELTAFMGKLVVLFNSEELNLVAVLRQRLHVFSMFSVIRKTMIFTSESMNKVMEKVATIQPMPATTTVPDDITNEVNKQVSSHLYNFINILERIEENTLRGETSIETIKKVCLDITNNGGNDNFDGQKLTLGSKYQQFALVSMVPGNNDLKTVIHGDDADLGKELEIERKKLAKESLERLIDVFKIRATSTEKNPYRLLPFSEIITGDSSGSSVSGDLLDRLMRNTNNNNNNNNNSNSNSSDKTQTPSNNLTMFLILVTSIHPDKTIELNPLHSKKNIKKTMDIIYDVFAGQVLGKLGSCTNPIFLKEGNLNGLSKILVLPSYSGEPVCLNSIIGTTLEMDSTFAKRLYRIFSRVRSLMSGAAPAGRARHQTGRFATLEDVDRLKLYTLLARGLVTATSAILEHVHNIVLEESFLDASSGNSRHDYSEAICHARLIMSTVFNTFPHVLTSNSASSSSINDNNLFRKKAYDFSRPMYRQMFLFVLGIMTVFKRRVAGVLKLLAKHTEQGKLSVKSFNFLAAQSNTVTISSRIDLHEQKGIHIATNFLQSSTEMYDFNKLIKVLSSYSEELSEVIEFFRTTFYEPFLFLESYAASAETLQVDFVNSVTISSLPLSVLKSTPVKDLFGKTDEADNLRVFIRDHFQPYFQNLSRLVYGMNKGDICSNFYTNRGMLSAEHSQLLDSPFILCKLFKHDQPGKSPYLEELMVPPISMSPSNMKKLILKSNSNGSNSGSNNDIGFSLASPSLFKENVSPNVNISFIGLKVPDMVHSSLKKNIKRQLFSGNIFEEDPNKFLLHQAVNEKKKMIMQQQQQQQQQQLPQSAAGGLVIEAMKLKRKREAEAKAEAEEASRKKILSSINSNSQHNSTLYMPNIMNPLLHFSNQSIITPSSLAPGYLTLPTNNGDLVFTHMSSRQHVKSNLIS